MKIFCTSDIKQIDQYTIVHEPISSIDLMKRASFEFYFKLMEHLPLDVPIRVFAGTGNNGGDAFFVAQYLMQHYQDVQVYFCSQNNTISEDCKQAKDIFCKAFSANIMEINDEKDLPILSSTDYIIDGLFGSGLNRPLSGFYAEIVKYINNANATVFSIDIPSGLMGEDNSNNILEHIIRADYTVTFQIPKLAFLFPENEVFVGKWEVINIGLHPKAIENTPTKFYLTDDIFVKKHIKKRAKFSHKGTYGHALIIGGSYGKIGAVALASRGCLRSGVGLLTVNVPKCGYEILQISVPEAMVIADNNEKYITEAVDIFSYNAIGLGIGLGKSPETVDFLRSFLQKITFPCVFDADALNILSENSDLLELIPPNSIFTPHPKELERLIGYSANSYEKLKKIISFATKYKIYVLLKGAHTVVVSPDGDCWFNDTGNPGMATGGSGDILCGVITGLLAQQYSPFEAAVLGAYFHGKAGDAAAEKRSESSLIAGDIADEIRIE